MLRTTLAAVLMVAPLLVSGQASAYSDKVRKLCANDYMDHCSQHRLGTAELRACMRKAGPKLTPSCVSALVESGEVSGKGPSVRRAGSQ